MMMIILFMLIIVKLIIIIIMTIKIMTIITTIMMIMIKNLQFGLSLLLSSRSVETTRTTVDNKTNKKDTNATIRDLKI